MTLLSASVKWIAHCLRLLGLGGQMVQYFQVSQPLQATVSRLGWLRGAPGRLWTHHILHVGSRRVYAGPDVVVIIQQGAHVPGRDMAFPAVPGHPQARQGPHSYVLGLAQDQCGVGHP